jgi:hypothetical protein
MKLRERSAALTNGGFEEERVFQLRTTTSPELLEPDQETFLQ